MNRFHYLFPLILINEDFETLRPVQLSKDKDSRNSTASPTGMSAANQGKQLS